MKDKIDNIEALFEQDGFHVIRQDESHKKPAEDRPAPQKEAPRVFPYLLNEKNRGVHVVTEQVEKVPHRQADIVAGSGSDYDIPSIIENLKWHMDRICENVIGRRDIVQQAIYAILTGEHMLLLSRTGMAKSYLANYIFNTFSGARVFSSQASKDQTPDNYFGPYNIDEFKKGRIRHNIKGSIIEANLVFLDEFFDASDVVLRALLTVLNERKFINGSEQIDASVHTAIATANYMRENEVTEAVLDRFTYKSIIPEDKNAYSQLLIDHTYAFSGGVPSDPYKKVSFNEVLYINEIIRNRNRTLRVEVPDYMYFMKNVMVNKFMTEMRKSDANFFISPRKQAKLSDFLRASAIMNNRFEVNADDLKNLYIPLCTLNSYISVKQRDKSEQDVFEGTYQQTSIHFESTGAVAQIEYLLKIRRIFQELRENPDKRDVILKTKGVIQSLMSIFKKIFPLKRSTAEEEGSLSISTLRNSVVELNPAVEEVRELKEGILKDYRDIY